MPGSREAAWFGQNGCQVRLAWGRRGARAAAEHGDILVVVDVLSFSTAVAVAVSGGAVVYPCGKEEDMAALAARWGAVAAVDRREARGVEGRFSLSPRTFLGVAAGTRVVLASPNGATCTRHGQSVPRLFVGALLNAAAVAEAAALAAAEVGAAITLLACGEQWPEPSDEGALRFALEDYLGAGAILAHLPPALSRSPEASVCEAAFAGSRGRLPELLQDCGSGIELRAKGFGDDVAHAARLNVYDAVPTLRDGIRLEAG